MMKEILELAVELQIMLVAGYAGFLVSDMGRGVSRSGHDAVFRVLAFGLLAQVLMAWGLSHALAPDWLSHPVWLASITIIIGIAAGGFWARLGRSWIATLMGRLGIYHDDHESTAWRSVLSKRKKLTFVQIRRSDGYVFQSYFPQVPPRTPHQLTLNDDGVAMYVTSYWGPNGPEEVTEVTHGDGFLLEYFPMASIDRITFGTER